MILSNPVIMSANASVVPKPSELQWHSKLTYNTEKTTCNSSNGNKTQNDDLENISGTPATLALIQGLDSS